jgi:hypothetical protein
MDGIEGFAPGGEHAYAAGMSAIDALRKLELACRPDHPAESDDAAGPE